MVVQQVERILKQPVARWLFRIGLTANVLTCLGILPCVAAAIVLVITGEVFPAGVLFLLGSLADLFDGALARLEGKSHDFGFGAWLDTVMDRLSEVTILCGVSAFFGAQYDPIGQLLSMLGLVTSLFVTLVKSAAGEYKVPVDWKGESQLLGRPARVAIISIGMLMTPLVGLSSAHVLWLMLIVLITLNVPVILYRIGKIYTSTIGR